MPTDLEIARAAQLRPIAEVAARAGIPEAALEPYGRFKAKVDLDFAAAQEGRPPGALVLVTGISPTAAGEGKTTTTIGLGDALNRLGTRAMICLREPSLGPCFGVKGGATGGGRAQVVPMEGINLHFTGDFHAITAANNIVFNTSSALTVGGTNSVTLAGVLSSASAGAGSLVMAGSGTLFR